MAEPRIVDISGIIEAFKERVVTLRAKAAANPYALDAAIMINECLNVLPSRVAIARGNGKSEYIAEKIRKNAEKNKENNQMVRLTQSLEHWLWENHRDKLGLIIMGHTEEMTEEMAKDYLAWCQTDEGRKYLVGGECHNPEIDKEREI